MSEFICFIIGFVLASMLWSLVNYSSDLYIERVKEGEELCAPHDGWKSADIRGNYECHNGVEIIK